MKHPDPDENVAEQGAGTESYEADALAPDNISRAEFTECPRDTETPDASIRYSATENRPTTTKASDAT